METVQKFEVGKEYEIPACDGDYLTYKVLARTAKTVTFEGERPMRITESYGSEQAGRHGRISANSPARLRAW